MAARYVYSLGLIVRVTTCVGFELSLIPVLLIGVLLFLGVLNRVVEHVLAFRYQIIVLCQIHY